jgi:hypothetical protein
MSGGTVTENFSAPISLRHETGTGPNSVTTTPSA